MKACILGVAMVVLGGFVITAPVPFAARVAWAQEGTDEGGGEETEDYGDEYQPTPPLQQADEPEDGGSEDNVGDDWETEPDGGY